MSSNSIAQRLTFLRQTLPPRVRLVAVSKQVSVESMREAYRSGQRDFAESRIQEALAKQEQLQDLNDIRWHFIGHLQTNKAKQALLNFHWLHTCDRLKLAQRLNQLAADLGRSPQICLQVKVLPDPNKYGWTVPELRAALRELNDYKNLKIQGLMTILPLGLSQPEQLSAFKHLRELGDAIAQSDYPHLKMEEFSMGMSGDYPLAVEAGATMVRLGQTLFGARHP